VDYLIIFILVSFLILIHELGHFIAAKLSNIPIERFSIGFGPKLCSFTRGKTEYRLSVFPIGGYLLPRIKNPDDFYQIPSSKRIVFALGGPSANLILSIISLGVLNTATTGFSFYGILLCPFVQVMKITSQFLYALPGLLAHPKQLSGIVGVVAIGGQFVAGDLSKILQFAIILSINLALLNLLPIPPLDGGKILFCLLERIHPSLVKLRIPLMVTGGLLLLGLICYITVIDVCRHILRICA